MTAMLVEAAEASKHARKRGRVMGIVAAHRVKQMRMGDWTNNRRRHFDRRREFKSRGKNSVTPGTSDEDGNGCRHPFGSCYPAKTKAQDIQRTEQAVRPRWKRREGPALERGCTSTFLFLG